MQRTFLLLTFSLCYFLAWNQNDSTSYVHLFDFDDRWYTPEQNAVRAKWEDEFIAFGKKAEKTPERYVKNILNAMTIDGGPKTLDELRLNYIFGTSQYALDYYRNTSQEADEFTRKYLREGYLFTHISRSNENIERLWAVFGSLIKEIAQGNLASGRPERIWIQDLLDSWSCITSKKGYKKKLTTCYNKLVMEKPDTYSMQSYVEGLICSDIRSRYEKKDQSNYTTNLQWMFTFWVRRYHEGNVEATLMVLNSLLQ